MSKQRIQRVAQCAFRLSLATSVWIGGCATEPARDGWHPGAAKNFNLAVVTLDTVRADHLGAYGYERADTPTIDRLASEGRLYTQAFSPVPMTLPAHGSIFTGRIPPQHGVRHNGQFRLDDQEVTLAEQLARTGYDTAAFTSAFVLDRRYGLAQGFELYDDEVAPAAGGAESERDAESVTDRALAWLGSRRGSSQSTESSKSSKLEPFFLWVHYYDPHADYGPPEPYASRFAQALYDGEIAYVDAQLARLVTALDRDSTVVVVVGDHGESLGEHGEATHSRSLYDATQRVPLIVWSPSLILPNRSSELVSLTDIFPTVTDLFALPNPGAKLDGQSLLVGVKAERTLYFETLATYLDSGWAPLYAMRSSQEKYVLAPRPEYYALENDPKELANLYEQTPRAMGPLAELRTALARQLSESAPIDEVLAKVTTPDAETLARLNSLGYLGGSGPETGSDSLMDPKDGLAIQQQLLEAESLRRQNLLTQALALAERAHNEAPQDLQALQLVGIINAQLGRPRQAERFFRDYLARKRNPNVALLLFKLLARTDRQQEALELMELSRREHPQHGGLVIGLADFHAEAGRFREAVELFRFAKRIDPKRVGTLADERIVEVRRLSSAR